MTFLLLITSLFSGSLFIATSVLAALLSEMQAVQGTYSLRARAFIALSLITLWVGNSVIFYYLAGYAAY
jgi:hypothetical protein